MGPAADEQDLLVAVLREAQQRGAIGPGSISGHIAHARGFAKILRRLVRAGDAILDLGAGGGLPGLVLATELEDARLLLLEGRTERARQLVEALATLDLALRVNVCPQRAELAGRDPELRGQFNAVVARGFGSPAVTAECAAPFLKRGGVLVVSEPPGAAESAARWPSDGCALFGLELEEVRREPYAYAVLRSFAFCEERYPRRVGQPTKRPLF